jgi:hypothetical protein
MGGGVYYTRAGMLASTSPPLRLVSFTGHVIPRHRIRMAASPFMYGGIIYSLTAAGEHSCRQEVRRHVSSARHVQLSKLSCLRTLPAVYIARPIITFNDFMLQVGEGHLILCRYPWR